MLEFFFPSQCFNCGIAKNRQTNPIGFFCFACQGKIKINRWLFCPVCNKKIPLGRQSCPSHSSPLTCLGIMGFYADPILKQAIWKYKYEFIEELGLPLANLLFEYFQQSFAPKLKPGKKTWLISFIPLAKKRERWRGFNQAEFLAGNLSQKTGLDLKKTLVRAKFKKPQMRLKNKAERLANIQNCFRIINPEAIKNKNIILVDDISASGATLQEAAKILKQGKAKRVFGLVLARNS
ncbi:MAG: phosphoribosyltransferase family protein [Patescibacteria group bacterium]